MTKILKILPLLLSGILPAAGLAKEPVRTVCGVVTKVSDGDTLTLHTGSTKVKARLYGIDAPETTKRSKKTGRVSKQGQTYGEEAHQALTQKVQGQDVCLDVIDIDRYQRAVSMVRRGDRLVNREMVEEGWAWAYREYLDRVYASAFIQGEETARRAQKGLWKQDNPTPPWEFRRLQRRK